jgi:hypothetical protein
MTRTENQIADVHEIYLPDQEVVSWSEVNVELVYTINLTLHLVRMPIGDVSFSPESGHHRLPKRASPWTINLLWRRVTLNAIAGDPDEAS